MLSTKGGLLTLITWSVFLSQASVQAADSANLTSITTSVISGSSHSATVPGAGSSTFSSSNTYNLNYTGETLGITSFTTGSGTNTVTYNPLAYAGTVTTSLVRWSGTQANNIVYQRVTGTSANTFTLAGPYQPLEEATFNSNNLNLGTDNLFQNTGDPNGNNNNIERVDVVFEDGLLVTDMLAFIVLERGASNSHDAFKIAPILSVDSNGVPLSYGSLVTFAVGSYGTTDVLSSSTEWLITRNNLNTPGGNAISPSSQPNPNGTQGIGGTTVSVTGSTSNRGLSVTAGTTIYGYSLFGPDVTGTGSQLLNINNSNFPKNTSSTGGIDLTAYTSIAANAVPEPATWGLLGLSAVIVGMHGRRKRQ